MAVKGGQQAPACPPRPCVPHYVVPASIRDTRDMSERKPERTYADAEVVPSA